MSTTAFRRLFDGIHLQEPSKDLLWFVFNTELQKLLPTTIETNRIKIAFDISFDGHLRAPPRLTGEAFIFHPVRATISMIWRQLSIGVRNFTIIEALLLHDSFEDAHKGGINPVLMRSEVLLRTGEETTRNVFALTKHKELRETSGRYNHRLILTGTWEQLWAKTEDREDNTYTFDEMPSHKRNAKIRETEYYLNTFPERIGELIEIDVRRRRLHPNWRLLPTSLFRSLRTALDEQKRKTPL